MADFGLSTAPSPGLVTVWLRQEDEAIDIRCWLQEAVEMTSSAAATVQAALRGWFVRRSVLSTAQLAAEIAAPTVGARASPRPLSPSDLYLHPLASRLGWVYCERGRPRWMTPNPVADALCLWADLPVVTSPPVGRASSAKKLGQRRRAAARALRDARVTRRGSLHLAVQPLYGSLFRSRSPWDRRRMEWATAAAARADEIKYSPHLLADADARFSQDDLRHPLHWRLPCVRRDLPHDDRFLADLRARFGTRAVDSLRADPARPAPPRGSRLPDVLRLDRPLDDEFDDDSSESDVASEASGGSAILALEELDWLD
jgi:hypothetical protein